jgi:hypothetical protein
MITIIFAPPRFGKTVLMTHFLNLALYDRQRSKAMWNELNRIGYEFEPPQHTVFANYDVVGKKFGYTEKTNYRINPYRLGYSNDKVSTHFLPPYSVIGITEGQKYFNSRMSMWFPDWQSRFYEQHGHNFLDIFIDVQRPTLIDLNIRELADFIEVLQLDIVYDKKNGRRISKLVWHIRRIENSNALDKYLASGKKDATCFTEETITANYNVFDCYDSRNCKPKFYDGHFDDPFDLLNAEPTEQSLTAFKEYVAAFDDELPKDFYTKRSAN